MIGQSLSHYRILEKLGQGGMGVVFKALDTHLDRFAAVKVLPVDRLLDAERKRRFVREAKAASALNHPGIVTVYDIDESDGVQFIAMEYVAGKTLQELIRAGGLRLSQSLDYAIQMADALARAHAAGIVHRDLKPSNVMVTDDGRVKVLDFGLAKLVDPRPAAHSEDITRTLSQATEHGLMLGTPAYMSPEQARGREVDHRTDIFSLGVAIYQMISGELPFHGSNAVETVDKLLNSPTPSLRSAFPEVPETLERAVSRATAKDPRERHQSMREFASDLRSLVLTPAPAAAEATVTAMAPARRHGRLTRGRVGFIARAVMLLALLFAPVLWPARPPKLLVVLPVHDVAGDAANRPLCDGLTAALADAFARLERLQNAIQVVPPDEVPRGQLTDPLKARRALGSALALTVRGSVVINSDQSIRLSLVLEDALTQVQLGARGIDLPGADMTSLQEEVCKAAADLLGLELKPDVLKLMRSVYTSRSAAYRAYLEALGYLFPSGGPGDLDRARDLFRRSIEEDPTYALAHAGLGRALLEKARASKQKTWAKLALDSAQKAVELDHAGELAVAHLTLGLICQEIGQPARAVEQLRSALVIDPRNVDASRGLALIYENSGKKADAERSYKQAIRLRPALWTVHRDAAEFYYHRARYKQAASEFREVVRLAPENARAHRSLGGVYWLLGDYSEADRAFRRSLELEETSDAYSNVATLLMRQERYVEAVPYLRRATQMGTDNHVVWGNLGDAYRQTPSLAAKAKDAYETAAELAMSKLDKQPKNGYIRVMRALYLARLGGSKEARQQADHAKADAPENLNVLFQRAVVYELTGDRPEALRALASILAEDYSKTEINSHSDLKDLRNDPRYRDLARGKSPR